MSFSTTDNIAQSIFSTQNELMVLLDNLFAGISELRQAKAKEKIIDAYENAVKYNVPFADKIGMITKAINESDIDEETKTTLVNNLSNYVKKQTEISAISGFNEIEKIFNRSPLSKKDKKEVATIMEDARSTLLAPYALTVTAAQYRSVMNIINTNDMSSQVTPVVLESGNYMFLYKASMKTFMENAAIASGYNLGRIVRPEKEEVMTQAACESLNKDKASVLLFKNIPAEMAEKAVIESGHVGAVTFAKEPIKDSVYYNEKDINHEHPLYEKYNLYCLGGETDEERENNYKAAQKIIALSAFAVTGNAQKLEKARMRHSANEYSKIQKVLDCIDDPEVQTEDSGRVYSIHTYNDSQGNRYVLTNDYIDFNESYFSIVNNGVESKPIGVKDVHDYRKTLESQIKCGTGQKVYISNERLNEINQEANEIMDKYNDPGLDPSSKMIQIQEKISDLSTQVIECDNPMIQASLKKDIRQYSIIFEAMNKNRNPNINKNMVIDRTIAAELDSHVFKGYKNKFITEEMLKDMTVENEASRYSIKHDGLEYIDGTECEKNDAIKILQNISVSDYICHEAERSVANSKDQNNDDRLTVDDVNEKNEILQRNLPSHVQEAIALVQGIEIERTGIDYDIINNIETKNSYIAAQNVKNYRQKAAENVPFRTTTTTEHTTNDDRERQYKDKSKDLER